MTVSSAHRMSIFLACYLISCCAIATLPCGRQQSRPNRAATDASWLRVDCTNGRRSTLRRCNVDRIFENDFSTPRRAVVGGSNIKPWCHQQRVTAIRFGARRLVPTSSAGIDWSSLTDCRAARLSTHLVPSSISFPLSLSLRSPSSASGPPRGHSESSSRLYGRPAGPDASRIRRLDKKSMAVRSFVRSFSRSIVRSDWSAVTLVCVTRTVSHTPQPRASR